MVALLLYSHRAPFVLVRGNWSDAPARNNHGQVCGALRSDSTRSTFALRPVFTGRICVGCGPSPPRNQGGAGAAENFSYAGVEPDCSAKTLCAFPLLLRTDLLISRGHPDASQPCGYPSQATLD